MILNKWKLRNFHFAHKNELTTGSAIESFLLTNSLKAS